MSKKLNSRSDGSDIWNKLDDLKKLRNPIASINMIMPIIKNQKAALTNDRPTGRELPAFRGELDSNDNIVACEGETSMSVLVRLLTRPQVQGG